MINKDKEVGGTHYADMKIEPIELIQALGLDFATGSIVKYISRYKNKNGLEDLKKARHYCTIALGSIDYMRALGRAEKLLIKMYCTENDFDDLEHSAILYAINGDLELCEKSIDKLITREEEA